MPCGASGDLLGDGSPGVERRLAFFGLRFLRRSVSVFRMSTSEVQGLLLLGVRHELAVLDVDSIILFEGFLLYS